MMELVDEMTQDLKSFTARGCPLVVISGISALKCQRQILKKKSVFACNILKTQLMIDCNI